jgi:cell wall-associated NlpC family hydrolase
MGFAEYAESQRHVDYVWGGGSSNFDCSALVQWAWLCAQDGEW